MGVRAKDERKTVICLARSSKWPLSFQNSCKKCKRSVRGLWHIAIQISKTPPSQNPNLFYLTYQQVFTDYLRLSKGSQSRIYHCRPASFFFFFLCALPFWRLTLILWNDTRQINREFLVLSTHVCPLFLSFFPDQTVSPSWWVLAVTSLLASGDVWMFKLLNNQWDLGKELVQNRSYQFLTCFTIPCIISAI